MAKNKGGRPPKNHKTGPKGPWKMTPDAIKKLEWAFAIGASNREACYYADISEPSYYAWVKDNPELLEKFQRLKERPTLKAREVVSGAIEDGDSRLAFDYLKTAKSDEFKEGLNIDANIKEKRETALQSAIKRFREPKDSSE